ncbi:hypothetical protein H012_gp085 [Acanthamoeba polyphaga moumouvirus]|uniref:Uncharacterized protein n=2 Tax=Moumouvirus TaxID=3080801 RepID=L7RCM6_9VIRU|nr:hypothetical protein H012_gp085 [Acanthamoeba polyphaga moumouvirus]AEX62255.1 hypothetical protein mv_L50 [Moumouvirus Monve]AGC02364.1 hypothetical protein Moumou_00847 [Acanthamoeba polyphaga moumouvirus]
MEFDKWDWQGVYKLDKPILGYKKIHCRKVKDDKWKNALAIVRVERGSTVVVPVTFYKNSKGLMKTKKVTVEKIEDFDGNTISDDHICESSTFPGPHTPVHFDSNGIMYGLGSNTHEEQSGYIDKVLLGPKYNYRVGGILKSASLNKNSNIVSGEGFFFYATRKQAKKSHEY